MDFASEEDQWALLTPQERWEKSTKLWQIYLSLGGSFDPQPDSQSPFGFEEMQRAGPAFRRRVVNGTIQGLSLIHI